MRRLEFDNRGLNELLILQGQNPKIISKILRLLIEITKTPFSGIGKPEPLKGTLAGYWSRRIDEKNRMVYKVE